MGASQEDLAQLVGVGQHTVSRWESGARAPRDRDAYWRALFELEGVAERLCGEALEEGEVSGRLGVWRTDREYWAASPFAARVRVPAVMHRAARTLGARGITVRIVAGKTIGG